MSGPSGSEPGDDAPASTSSSRDTALRLIVSPIVFALIGGVLVLQAQTGSAVGTHLVLALFGALAGLEFAQLFVRGRGHGDPLLAAVGCGLLGGVGLFAMIDGVDTMGARVGLLVVLLLVVLCRHLLDVRPEAVDSITLGFLPVLYIGLPFSFMADFAHDWRLIGWVVLTSKASDIAGWAIGVPFGKHKIFPTLSPGKSWEGTIAGIAASAATAALLPAAFGDGWGLDAVSPAGLAVIGALLGAVSILAGATWSGWKRRLAVKHSGVIPGMGGIVDMVDSLLLAGPTAQACLLVVVGAA